MRTTFWISLIFAAELLISTAVVHANENLREPLARIAKTAVR